MNRTCLIEACYIKIKKKLGSFQGILCSLGLCDNISVSLKNCIQWNLYKADTLKSEHLYKTDSMTRNGLLCFAVKLSQKKSV